MKVPPFSTAGTFRMPVIAASLLRGSQAIEPGLRMIPDFFCFYKWDTFTSTDDYGKTVLDKQYLAKDLT